MAKQAKVYRIHSADGTAWVDVLRMTDLYVQWSDVKGVGEQGMFVHLDWTDGETEASRSYETIQVSAQNADGVSTPVSINAITSIRMTRGGQGEYWDFLNSQGSDLRNVRTIRIYNRDAPTPGSDGIDWEAYSAAMGAPTDTTTYIDCNVVDAFNRINGGQATVFQFENDDIVEKFTSAAAGSGVNLDPFQIIVNASFKPPEPVGFDVGWITFDTIAYVDQGNVQSHSFGTDYPISHPGVPYDHAIYDKAFGYSDGNFLIWPNPNNTPYHYYLEKPCNVWGYYTKNGALVDESLWAEYDSFFSATVSYPITVSVPGCLYVPVPNNPSTQRLNVSGEPFFLFFELYSVDDAVFLVSNENMPSYLYTNYPQGYFKFYNIIPTVKLDAPPATGPIDWYETTFGATYDLTMLYEKNKPKQTVSQTQVSITATWMGEELEILGYNAVSYSGGNGILYFYTYGYPPQGNWATTNYISTFGISVLAKVKEKPPQA